MTLGDYIRNRQLKAQVVFPTFRENYIKRRWIVFECKGAMPKATQDMWQKIVSEFFPTSGYQPTYEMDIEAYTVGNMDSPNYRSEICVPVIKK